MPQKTTKRKIKFPESRETKSELVKNNSVIMAVFSTVPRTEIVIKAQLTDECQKDVKAAIDEVLSFHGY